jgi:DNA-directed RNA polymerase subunit omega
MIKTGRDARVKSEIQNRALLILEEIHEGKDQFDEIKTLISSSSSEMGLNGTLAQQIVYEGRLDKSKYRTSEVLEDEE